MEKNNKNYVSLTEKGKEFYIFFLRFLKENKAFYPFKEAFLKRHDISYFKALCNNNDLGIINQAIIWADTAQGYSFWLHLYNKFFDEWTAQQKKKIIDNDFLRIIL